MGTQNFEQQVTLYHNIFVYCAIAAAIFLVIAIALFFLLKIPRVFGELTGRDARKAINEMVAENAATGSLTSKKIGDDGRRRRKEKSGSLGTGRLKRGNTGEIAGQFAQNESVSQTADMNGYEQTYTGGQGGYPTEPMDSYGSSATDVLDNFGSSPTDVLDSFGGSPTDVLDDFGGAQTDVLNVPHGSAQTAQMYSQNETADFTMTYQQPSNETMVLSQELTQGMGGKAMFVIERSIVEIHTNEVI